MKADSRLAEAREKMRALGTKGFISAARRKTEMELEIEEGIREADRQFFDSIERDLRSRRDEDKPISAEDYYK